MFDDYFVSPRSARDIENTTLAWRDALSIRDAWAPCLVRILEIDLPRLIPEFALVVRSDADMNDAEAFTEFAPPRIVVRQSVYRAALEGGGRARMTLAHELGHLLMHAHDRRLHRMAGGNRPAPTSKKYETAEWQASKFGSLFLMPEHIVADCRTVGEIVQRCQVTPAAARIRFEQVGHAKEELPGEVVEVVKSFKRSSGSR